MMMMMSPYLVMYFSFSFCCSDVILMLIYWYNFLKCLVYDVLFSFPRWRHCFAQLMKVKLTAVYPIQNNKIHLNINLKVI